MKQVERKNQKMETDLEKIFNFKMDQILVAADKKTWDMCVRIQKIFSSSMKKSTKNNILVRQL